VRLDWRILRISKYAFTLRESLAHVVERVINQHPWASRHSRPRAEHPNTTKWREFLLAPISMCCGWKGRPTYETAKGGTSGAHSRPLTKAHTSRELVTARAECGSGIGCW
jgi:hypothetical protein